MKATAKFYQRLLVILFLMMLPLIAGNRPALAENPESSKAVFYVQ